ncbi:MAG: hypothetical protein QF415_16775 [Candidatus Undinarchaeales archaeon]|nr:hypothetical protein [Candidatus Undinarchaeales archaeon]
MQHTGHSPPSYWIDVGRCEDYETVNHEVKTLDFINRLVGE